jgi:crossover junction endodeoxyribonuclease RuvC
VSDLRPRILGVDPGSLRAGWAVLEGDGGKPRLVACGEVDLPRRLAFPDRLARLHTAVVRIVREHGPTEAAVEAPFHGVSARAALQLAHARGVVLAALGAAGVPVHEYAPAAIKMAVTGHGRAEKSLVQAMVARFLPGGPAASGADVADAMAAALCHVVLSRSYAARIPARASRETSGARRGS